MSSDDNDAKLPDLRYIRELAKMFKHYDLDELEIETGETRMLLRRGDLPSSGGAPAVVGAAAPAAQVAAPAAAATLSVPAPVVETGDFITSPFVGTFYRSARPDADAFVEVGSKVQPGQAVCIVEAMKLFNEIESDFGCEILEVLTENGQAVEYGAKLFRVRKL